MLRGGLRFLRYSYPLLLILFYFEEVAQTVNAMWSHAPHWFESYLYAADRWLFGELPALMMNGWVGLVQDELMHAFYFSYYLILIGGVVIAWMGEKGSPKPAPGFQSTLTSVITAFFLCYVWYPYLPARGPWENPELMARMTPFTGVLFVPIIERIIEHGAVSGGCFPSAHVAGAWGIAFGLLPVPEKACLGSRVLRARDERGLRLYPLSPRGRCAGRFHGGPARRRHQLQADRVEDRNDLFLRRHTLFVDHSALGLVDDFLGEDEKVLKIRGDPLRARSLHRLGQARLFQLCCNALSGAIGFFRHLQ